MKWKQERGKTGMEGEWKNKYIGSKPAFSTSLQWFSLLIIISPAAILCVPKEITMIQQEVSHLSFSGLLARMYKSSSSSSSSQDGSFVFI